ncbi:MAG: hydroxyacid dehydrogenase, partial [Candidatus Micrarchaeota archaeon]|nr:hydroxyacid dehydrogenase [Candidatus Micrarchaeota archaeon]
MKRIAFFELEPWEKDHLKKKLQGFKLDFYDGTLEKKDWPKIRAADALVVFIYSPVPASILGTAPKLKFVSTMSTGFDHVDVAGLKKKGVTVCNVPEYGSNTVAEHTFALLLSLSRFIPASVERTKKGDFNLEGLRGWDLAGKTIGIIGT